MNATTRRTSATTRELQDWRVWAIGGGGIVALGYQALQHLGWRAALAAPPLAAAGALGAWAWMRQRPTGFAAEATRAIVAQMPDGSRPPRLVFSRQEGAVWEMAWRLRDRSLGRPLLKKAAAIADALDAEVQMRFDRDRLSMRAGTALVPDGVRFEDFYRHNEPPGELVVGIGESRWGALWADLILLPHLLVGGTTKFGKSVMVRQILARLATRYSPEHVKLALVDFKRVELNLFEGLPHVTPPDGQAASLAVAKDLDSYLELLRVLSESLDERKLRFDLAGVADLQEWSRRGELGGRLPYVVLVIDELAELSVEEAADQEERKRRQEALALLSRLARLGRALGFHILAATQRPAVDTVPGPIKSRQRSPTRWSTARRRCRAAGRGGTP